MIRVIDMVYSVANFTLKVSLEVEKGEYFVVMGPTGSGKSAFVECLAGLRRPSFGRIEIGGRDVTHLPPRARMIGYVPQDYALFRHRTVRGNIAFGPIVRRWIGDLVDKSVQETAELLRIAPLLGRHVTGLSGGESQRVALARALAMRPEILILDEPVSALDESTRQTICAEIRHVQRELNITTIHVSHNIEEAFTVADRAVILHDGRVEQVGSMGELLRRPRNEFVARFMRCENIFHGRTAGRGTRTGRTVVMVNGVKFEVPFQCQGEVMFMVRPENIEVLRSDFPGDSSDGALFQARIARIIDSGSFVRLEFDSFLPVVAHVPLSAIEDLAMDQGVSVLLHVKPGSCHLLSSRQNGTCSSSGFGD